MNRDEALTEATTAADKARHLAAEAQRASTIRDLHSQTQMYAAASGAWADTARVYIALAAELGADEKTED
ncbi:hypothetical protein E2C11_29555 [Streptomyces lavendulae]|nr:hypothetical protein [Streptomyces lavendulae]TXJ73289.1 hypothetical protein E2C11_29555 [Streptomyces lavendulae]